MVVVHDGAVDRRHEASGAVVVMMMVVMRVQAARGAPAAVAMVLRAVAGREAVVGGRHVRVADEPAREVRRPRVLVTAPRGRSRVQGVVVTVVMVHHGVVRESRHETHADTRTSSTAHSRALPQTNTVLLRLLRLSPEQTRSLWL